MSTPRMGKYGAIAIALQTAVGTAADAPTNTLRTTAFGNPMPEYTYTNDEIADGTIFESGEQLQGVAASQRQITAQATLADLPVLLTAMLGTPGTASGSPLQATLTPRLNDYAALAPGQPLTVWQPHPVRNSLFTDVQISSIVITISSRATATVQVTFNTTRVSMLGSVPVLPAIATAELAKFMNFFVKYATNPVLPTEATITITQPMEAEDAAQGLDSANNLYAVGWSRSGPLSAMVNIRLGAATIPDTMRAAYEAGSDAVLEAGFKVGTKELSVKFPHSRVSTFVPDGGLGRIVVPIDIKATYNAGAPSFEWKLPG
ncbi:hypothetical protein [Deinococcus irradiatisoli]|nr:hypothetical protein [Deinococcus irradiatisoli]